MPIMSANAQCDARGAAWLLASAARNSISDPASAAEWYDALNNTYRLLEAFRNNVFFGLRPPRTRQHVSSEADMLTIAPSSERHLAEVCDALESALASTFESMSKDQAVERIENVLRAVAAPDRFHASEDDKARAARFFNELLRRLGDG